MLSPHPRPSPGGRGESAAPVGSYCWHSGGQVLGFLEKVNQQLLNVVDHCWRDSGINAYEEGVGHEGIRVGQGADHAVRYILERRLAEKVSAKELPRLHAMAFQVIDEVIS